LSFVPPYGLASRWGGAADESFVVLILDLIAMKRVVGAARSLDEYDEAV